MRIDRIQAVALATILVLTASFCAADTHHWSGGGADNFASTAENWVEGAPSVGDDIVLDAATNKPMIWNSDAPTNIGSWSQVGYLGTVTVATIFSSTGFSVLAIAGDCAISNGCWTHAANAGAEIFRLSVIIGGKLSLGPDARIDAYMKGFAGSSGYGVGANNVWASSHGGHGGIDGAPNVAPRVPAPTYDSLTSPTNLGSGLYTGSGGGAVRLQVGGTMVLDGLVAANGDRPGDYHCTPSGGSIWITAGSLTGTGSVKACGGTTDGRTCGGGGGRIALVVTNDGADFGGFSGVVSAAAGKGGGAGTIYREKPADNGRGELVVDNNVWSPGYVATRLGGAAAVTCDFSRIVLTNAGNLGLFGNDLLIVTNTEIVWAGPSFSNGISLYGASLALPVVYAWSNGFIRIHTNADSYCAWQDITLGTNALLIVNRPNEFSNIVVKAGGTISHDPNWDQENMRVNLTVASNLTLDVGGAINVNRRGYGPGWGPGVGVNNTYAGSHGGLGCAVPAGIAKTYGSIAAPTNLGSGAIGNQGYDKDWGGGVAILNVGGVTTLNGSLTADGGPRDGNGAAPGGSIFLTTGRLTGSGLISARGGTGSGGCGGGGGGRVSIMLTNATAAFSEFGGSMSAAGQGAPAGGAGTVYLRAPGQATNAGALIVDNGGLAAAVGAMISTNVIDTAVGDVLIRSNGVLSLAMNQSLTVGGMWSNGAAFSATTGASVIFAGSNVSTSTIYGTTIFQRVSCATPGKTLEFAAGASNAVREALTLAGAGTTNIFLRSTRADEQWRLNVFPAAVQSVNKVDVQDSDASPGATVVANSSVNMGNNSNWSFVVSGQTNIWTGSSNTAWGVSANWSQGRLPSLLDDKAVVPAGCTNYPVLDAPRQVSGFELQSGAALDLNGWDFTAFGAANMAGALSAIGAERIWLLGDAIDFSGPGAVTAAFSTVIIGGAVAQAVNLAGKTFWDLKVTNTADTVTLSGGCTARQLLADAGTGTVRIAFAPGGAFNIRDFVMPGSAASTNISLCSASPGSPWLLNVTGYSKVTGADVADSDARGGKTIYPMNSRDSSGNTNWIFDGDWRVWLGTTSTNYGTPENWNPASVPDTGSLVLVERTNLMTIGTAAAVKRLMLGGDSGTVQVQVFGPLTVAGDITVGTGAIFSINQPVAVSNDFIVLAGGTLTHAANIADEKYKIILAVQSNLYVDTNGVVDVNYKGYGPGQGPGPAGYSGWDTCGASHGGQGAKGAVAGAPTYGSILAPTNLGSGAQGGSGNLSGGGAIILDVKGVTTLNGQMLANGGARDGNCTAAGGSVFLTTGRLLGSGAIRANGGIAGSCGGGGGRIAVALKQGAEAFTEFTGSMTAVGQGSMPGGAGTICLIKPGLRPGGGDVIVDNSGQTAASLTFLPPHLLAITNELRYARLLVTNQSTRLTLSADLQVADVFLYTNTVLNLSNFDLYVFTRQHDLGGGTTNTAGGRIFWINIAGSVFNIR